MADWLTELRYSGLPNRTLELTSTQGQSFWSVIADLTATATEADGCWRCAPPSQMDYMLTRSEGEEHECVIITGEYVISARGTLHDSSGEVRAVLNVVLALAVSGGPGWMLKAKTKTGDERRCTHPEGKHNSSTFDGCHCGSPSDAGTWLAMKICEASNCYNYAVKDIWCKIDNAALESGATPQSLPADMTDYNEWAAILALDGIVEAAGPTTPPTGYTSGWHIAVAVNKRDFHFLRRDGDIWTHKFGQKPPQICDGAGAGIPEDKLAEADLCDYQLVGYFFVPEPLKIDH